MASITAPAEQTAQPADDASRVATDRLILTAAGGGATWVLSWLAVQLHASLGWALPFIPGSR